MLQIYQTKVLIPLNFPHPQQIDSHPIVLSLRFQ